MRVVRGKLDLGRAMIAPPRGDDARYVGRYAIHGEIAAGGMATVHYGRLIGTAGFARNVAIKRLYPHFAKDPEFVAMFLDEAQLAARIQHPNVVPTLDVVATEGELFIVMEYVQGETLARLLRPQTRAGDGRPVPPRISAALIVNVLLGLHAAHEARGDDGGPLGIVHRDVSPQNVLVGIDGVTRVLDFGIAKARDRIHITRGGLLKGKLAYMSPEQLEGAAVDRRTDVYAAGVLLWECLIGRRLFQADGEMATAQKVKAGIVELPSRLVPGLGTAFDTVLARALAKAPADRFATAREMALALEQCVGIATPSEVGAWVEGVAAGALEVRAKQVARIERSSEQRGRADTQSGAHDAPTVSVIVDVDPDGSAPTIAIDHVVPPVSGTQLSVAAQGERTAPRKRRAAWVGAAAAGCLLAITGAVVLVSRGRDGTASARAATSAGEPEPAPAASIATVNVADLPVAPPAESASSAVTAAAPVRSDPATPSPAARPTAHPVQRAVASPSGCNPPYTVDARGVRHLKPQCL
jgi:serine/threonine-protein kinase